MDDVSVHDFRKHNNLTIPDKEKISKRLKVNKHFLVTQERLANNSRRTLDNNLN
jgi:hypothetical protein